MFLDAFGSDSYILLAALLLISGVIVAKFSTRIGVPALVLFILVGMLIGSDGLGVIYFDNAEAAQTIGIFALIVILFEGGLQTKWSTVRSVAKPALSLATLGVFLTSSIVAFTAWLVFNITWYEAFLFGAIVGSTDAAAVFAALKERNIKARLGATLEAESGTNDPMAVFLTLSFIELALGDGGSLVAMVPDFFWQMGVGLGIGYLIGRLSSWAINHINLESSGLYPIFSVAFALLTYSVASFVEASGFLAVYVAALVIGNSELTYRYSIFQFNEGFAWMAQILMFIILGLLAFPEQVFSVEVIMYGLLLSFVLMFIARPAAVFLSTLGMKFSFKERLFLSWAGLRGAVPIVLATFPVVAGLEMSGLFFNVVFFVVLTSALIQGSTISPLAKALKLTGPKKDTPHHAIELISIGKANAEMVQYKVDENSKIVGQKLHEIPFPNKANVSAIVRDETLITPYGETEIHSGDFLYILVSRKEHEALKQVLHSKRTKKPLRKSKNTGGVENKAGDKNE
ncbi:potassium/proton antiporter (CPA1 family) [Salsuginibacillus halophilus]|uniref:Potassium/proton antiporter (CPA1 family) n=1 Tax=Salsuginibacillus halophilus TaxID=517424 RepID=A0A2P8HIC4_9BACI|nr:potassium/proton antiporter [Salsuginibacillus halophilus]PSL45962.1 potassium/proton antiporter (CPA1 family) [Salsuginibacillus halophilus]